MAKIELTSSGVRELLRSSEVEEMLSEHGKRIKSRCGEGYESNTYQGRTRCNVMIYADTYEAKRDNSKHNTILKSIK